MPRGTGRRERVATPAEAEMLIAALPESERALWATCFYAGLRVGETRALRCDDVDTDGGVIRVRRSWDDVEGEQEGGKSEAAVRDVAIIDHLRPFLVAHMLGTGRRGSDLIFGRTATEAYDRGTIRRRAWRAWGWKEVRNPQDEHPKRVWVKARPDARTPIGQHECRHTFESIMAAAGVDASERLRQMGHTSSAMMEWYTHGIPGSILEAGRRVQAWLDDYREATG